MAKKNQIDPEQLMKSLFGESENLNKKWSDKELKRIFNKTPNELADDELLLLFSAVTCFQNGITPETYHTVYKLINNNPLLKYLPTEAILSLLGEKEDDWDDEDDDFNPAIPITNKPLANANKKSLVLKIQLRGVTKPPIWREIRIPANINFFTLHKIIQTIFGWKGYHLWQYEVHKNGQLHTISMPDGNNDVWNDEPTDIANKTSVTTILKKVGDKIEYTYDFGDNWIHDITVKEVIDEKTDYPICLKFKSGNPIEDIGGIWGLEDFRKENGVGSIDLNKLNEMLRGLL